MTAKEGTSGEDGLQRVTPEQLNSLSSAIPKLLGALPEISKRPEYYYSRLPCFLHAFSYGGAFRLTIGHLLELWELGGYLRDGDCFFYGGAGGLTGSSIWGVNTATSSKRVIIAGAQDVFAATNKVFGLPEDRIVFPPEAPPEPATFEELISWVTSLGITASEAPPIKPLFLKKIEEEGFSPTLPVMDFVRIPAGDFLMGVTDSSSFFEQAFPGQPVHVGEFEMLSSPVTNSLWYEVTNQAFPNHEGRNAPSSCSWNEAAAFARLLSEIDRNFSYRLPTVAEWEYACKAGTTTRFYWGDEPRLYKHSVGKQKLASVGIEDPNPMGIYDIGFSVPEWVSDNFHPLYPCRSVDKGWCGVGYRTVKGAVGEDGLSTPHSFSQSLVPWANQLPQNGGVGFRLVRIPKREEVQND